MLEFSFKPPPCQASLMIFQLPLGLISHETCLTARRQGEAILDSCGSPAKAGYSMRMEAFWWQTEGDGGILCTLCPRFGHMSDGQAGFCYIHKTSAVSSIRWLRNFDRLWDRSYREEAS
jgi:hypothetical protein